MAGEEAFDLGAAWERGLGAEAGDGQRAGGAGAAEGLRHVDALGEGGAERAAEGVAGGGGVYLLHGERFDEDGGAARAWEPEGAARAQRDHDGAAPCVNQHAGSALGAVEVLHGDAGERFGLALIGQQDVDQPPHRVVERGSGIGRGGGIEQREDAARAGEPQAGEHRRHRNLEAGEQRRGAGEGVRRFGDLVLGDAPVRARDGDDAVLAARLDQRQGDARASLGVAGNPGGVDTLAFERPQEERREEVFAEPPDHAHAGAEARSGDRLVAALAADEHAEVRAEDGLARAWPARRTRDEVHHEARQHDDGVVWCGSRAAYFPPTRRLRCARVRPDVPSSRRPISGLHEGE